MTLPISAQGKKEKTHGAVTQKRCPVPAAAPARAVRPAARPAPHRLETWHRPPAPARGNRDNTQLLRDEARWAGEPVPAAGEIPCQHLSGKIKA